LAGSFFAGLAPWSGGIGAAASCPAGGCAAGDPFVAFGVAGFAVSDAAGVGAGGLVDDSVAAIAPVTTSVTTQPNASLL
jgi:hypothetical protein